MKLSTCNGLWGANPRKTELRLALAGLALLALLGLPRAEAQPQAQSSFARALSPDLQRALVVEVPLVSIPGARVVLANHDALEQRGLLRQLGLSPATLGLHDKAYEDALVKAFAFRPATKEEIDRGAYTHVGLATRYADRVGAVRGDGRAVLLGDVMVKDRAGRIAGVYDIQVKGIGTPLRPGGDFAHNHGKEALRQAVEDALFSDYLARNGMSRRSNDWLAVIDTAQYIEHPDGGMERAGLLVRGGSFLRMAHLLQTAGDLKTLGQLVEHTNRQVSLEMGRDRLLSTSGLFKVLGQRKAEELADLYWLRTVHGSITYDNIGLLETMDHATASTVDRTHPGYTFFRCSPGYAREASQVLAQYVSSLLPMLRSVAGPEDRQALDQLKAKKMLEGMFARRMTRNALLHAGFTEEQVSTLLTRQATASAAFQRVVSTIASRVDRGGPHTMRGPDGSALVAEPARYDLFAALSKLAAVSLAQGPEARAKALAQVLRPKGQVVDDEDLAQARQLLESFDRVARPIFERYTSSERVGLARLMRDSAEQRNRYADGMLRESLHNYARTMAARVEAAIAPEQMDRIRAELNAFRRRSLVAGPGTAAHAAQSVLARRAPTVGGRVLLGRDVENGVAIEQLSDGSRDFVQVVLAGNPLGGDARNHRMRFTLGGEWRDVGPAAITPEGVVFELEVTGKAPKKLEAAFFDTTTQRWWNNAGLNFGRDTRMVLGSPGVQVALGVEARRRSSERAGLKPQLALVGAALHREDRTRPRVERQRLPRRFATLERRVGRSVDPVLQIRTAPLRPSRGPRPQAHAPRVAPTAAQPGAGADR